MAMFDDREWITLVGRLSSLTQGQKLNWKTRNDVLVTRAANFLYRIGSSDNDGRQPFYLSVSRGLPLPDSEAEVFSEIDQVDSLNEASFDPWSGDTLGQRIIILHDLALRDAQGAPQIFEELLDGLSSLGDSDAPF